MSEGRWGTIEELRENYRANGLGEKVYALLFDIALLVSKRLPLAGGGYARSLHTSRNPLPDDEPLDQVHELVNDFYEEHLVPVEKYKKLAEKKFKVVAIPSKLIQDPERGPCAHWALELAFHPAMKSLDGCRGILYRAMEKAATRTKAKEAPTVIDSLWDRVAEILNDDPYTVITQGRENRYFLGRPTTGRRSLQAPSVADLDLARRSAHSVTTLKREEGYSEKTGKAKEASMVYETDDLKELVRRVGEALPMGFTQRDFRKILEDLLPSWHRGNLESLDEEIEDGNERSRGDGEENTQSSVVAMNAADEYFASLTAEECGYVEFALRSQDSSRRVSVNDSAAGLGVPRQTVRNRSKKAFQKWTIATEGLSQTERNLFAQYVSERAMDVELPGGDDD